MKIKLSKSQWEAMGKTAGWMKPNPRYETRINGGLLQRYNSLAEADKGYALTLKDLSPFSEDETLYLVEITEKVLRSEPAQSPKGTI